MILNRSRTSEEPMMQLIAAKRAGFTDRVIPNIDSLRDHKKSFEGLTQVMSQEMMRKVMDTRGIEEYISYVISGQLGPNRSLHYF